MKDFITQTCETCKKEIYTFEEWQECFDKNNTLRTRGQLILKDMSEAPKEDEIIGIATKDIKKGQIGAIKI